MSIIRSDRLPTETPTQETTVHQTTDGKTVIHQKNDVSGILKANAFQRNEQSLHHESEIMNHYARVDVIVLKNWCETRGIIKNWWARLFEDEGKLFREFLNDPENEAWRTRKGKI